MREPGRMQTPTSARTRAIRLVPLLAAAFGLIFLVRYASGYLAPYMLAELGLGARHLGLLSASLAFAWAVAGWAVPAMAARNALRRYWLAAAVFMVALSCIGSWLADGLYALVACRILAGAAGGPALPMIQGVVASHLDARHRGLHMGLIQGFGGSLLAAILGPLLIIPMGHDLGWRSTMLWLGIAVAACSLGLHWALAHLGGRNGEERGRGPSESEPPERPSTGGSRNIGLCCLIGSLLVGWLILNTTFVPLYLSSERHFDSRHVSEIMSWLGVGSLAGVLIVPWLSDALGRRSVMAAAAGIGALAPWALLNVAVQGPMLSTLVFLGSLAGGCFPLFLAVIPSESVPAARIITSVGLVQAVAEISGGVAAPAVLGWLADTRGLATPLIGSMLACPLAAFAALLMSESSRRTPARAVA